MRSFEVTENPAYELQQMADNLAHERPPIIHIHLCPECEHEFEHANSQHCAFHYSLMRMCGPCQRKNMSEHMKAVSDSGRQRAKKASDLPLNAPFMCKCGHGSNRHGNKGRADCLAMVEATRFCPCKVFQLAKESSHDRPDTRSTRRSRKVAANANLARRPARRSRKARG